MFLSLAGLRRTVPTLYVFSTTSLYSMIRVVVTSVPAAALHNYSTIKENLLNGPTQVEVERGKSQLKASLLLSLDGSTATAEDVGRQLVTSGRRMTPKQIESTVDAVTSDEIKRVAHL